MNTYANEKFLQALDILVLSTHTLQQRLGDAVVYQLIHIDSKNLPDSIKEQFIEFMNGMTSETAQGNEGKIAATVSKMSDDKAIDLARIFMNIYHQLNKV